MNEYKWEKPIITVDEILTGLAMQYGPDNRTKILMDDTAKPISYKTALLNCECLRCGKRFTATPYGILNGLYLNGYVCANCGMLSDDEVRQRKTESRRKAALEVLKEDGQDVVKEAIEEMQEDKEVSEEIEVTEDSFDDNDEMITAENLEKEIRGETNGTRSSESATIKEDQRNDLNDGRSRSISSEPSETESIEEVGDEGEKSGPDDGGSSGRDEEGESLWTEQPEPSGDEMKKSDYMADDKDTYSSPISEMLTDLAKSDGEEDSVTDDDDEDVFGVEEPEPEPVKTVESVLVAADAPTEEAVEDESPEAEDAEEEASDDDIATIGDETLTVEEIGNRVWEACKKSRDTAGLNLWDSNVCHTTPDNKIEIKCKTCGKNIKSDSIETYGIALPLDKLLSQNGGTYDPNKENNIDKSVPYVNVCPVCLDSIKKNGFNLFHKKSVIAMAKKSHFFIKNADNHYFIKSPKEYYVIECNGVERKMLFSEMISHFSKGEDARNDLMFKVEKNEDKKPTVTVKMASKESVSPIKTEEVKPAAVKQTITLNKNVNESKSVPLADTAAKMAFRMGVIWDKKNATSTTGTSEGVKPKITITLGGKKPEPKNEQKATIRMSETKQQSMNGSVFSAKDSFESMNAERDMENDNIEKHNVFSAGAKFKRLNKNIAQLDGSINPFEREVDLEKSFENTCFYDFIESLSQKTGVEYTLIIDARSYEVPVVDFESGIRIICSDLNEPSLVNMQYSWVNPRVPFSYKDPVRKKPKSYDWKVLFSDSIEYARNATFCALVKLINPKILPYGSKKIMLQNNLVFNYTTNSQYLEDFDRRFSTYPSKKPSTNRLGIIARWTSTKEATAKDVLKWRLQMERLNNNVSNLDSLANDYDEYMVASIKYIKTFNKETNKVLYTITDYVEVGSAIIGDGFLQCLRALLKEYMMEFPHLVGTLPHVVVEYDPNTIPSPSLKSYIDRGTFVPVDEAYNLLIEGPNHVNTGVDKFFRYSMVRRPEYRDENKSRDYMRQDLRLFEIGTIIHTMKDEIAKAGLSNTIRNPDIRKQFIANMGYIKATQVEVKKYHINQLELLNIMNDGFTINLPKHVEEDGFMQKTNMVMDSNAGIGLNNIMANPAAFMRYQHIFNNGSTEAKDYFNRMMMDEQRQRMMEYMTNFNNAQQGNSGVIHENIQQVPIGTMNFAQAPQFNPMMGMGMNPMMPMGMMGGFGMWPTGN